MLMPDLRDMDPILPDDFLYGTYAKSVRANIAAGIPASIVSKGENYLSSMAAMQAMMAALPRSDPTGLTGNLFCDPWMCEFPMFVRWKRKHRRSRINKKWQKRYGAVYEPCKGVAYNVGGNLHVCPCMAEKMKSLLESRCKL